MAKKVSSVIGLSGWRHPMCSLKSGDGFAVIYQISPGHSNTGGGGQLQRLITRNFITSEQGYSLSVTFSYVNNYALILYDSVAII